MPNLSSLRNEIIVVNRRIVFHPKKRMLKHVLSGSCVTLHTPATYCLLYLLLNREHLCNKEDLIKHSWCQDSSTITDNTYYQMIFHLRKGLESVGGDQVLLTIPRRGLQINTEVSVQVFNLKEVTYIGSGKQEKTNEPLISGASTATKKNLKKLSFIAFFIALLLILIDVINMTHAKSINVTQGYEAFSYKKCAVKYNQFIQEADIKKWIEIANIDCTWPQSVIMTRSENNARLSTIVCHGDSFMGKQCSLTLFVK